MEGDIIIVSIALLAWVIAFGAICKIGWTAYWSKNNDHH